PTQLPDSAFDAREGAVLDLDAIAAVEFGLGMGDAGNLFALPAQHPLHFVSGHGWRSMVDASAHKISHSRSLAKQIKNAVVVFDLHHQIAGVKFPLSDDPFAPAHLRDFFHRDDDLAKVFF